jgi:hypothetical protein
MTRFFEYTFDKFTPVCVSYPHSENIIGFIMKINLKLLDIDGCLYHKYISGGYNNEPHEQWFLKSNEVLLRQIAEEINTKEYDKVVLAYGTNRQDYSVDRANSFRGGSLAPALPLLQKHLQKKVHAEVVIEPFLMADVYGKPKLSPATDENRTIETRNLAAGDSYKNILRAKYTNVAAEIEHANWVFDHSKISLIYAQAHRIASLHPNAEEIIIDFYDDSPNILNQLETFFAAYPEMLPRNVVLNIKQYTGETPIQQREIKGTGDIDTQYDWSVRYFSSKFYFFNSAASEDRDIATADRLQQYHEEDHYRNRGHDLEMRIEHRDFKLTEFMTMRQNEFAKLPHTPQLTAEAYTTADALYAQGLIPNFEEEVHHAVDNNNIANRVPDEEGLIPYLLDTEEAEENDEFDGVYLPKLHKTDDSSFLLKALCASALVGGIALLAAAVVAAAFAASFPVSIPLTVVGTALTAVGATFFYRSGNKKPDDVLLYDSNRLLPADTDFKV